MPNLLAHETFRPEPPTGQHNKGENIMGIKRKAAVIVAAVAMAMAGTVGVAAAASNTGGCAGFSDVAPGSQFCADITWMHDTGIAKGFTDGTYKPTDATTRQAMSAFMHRFADTVTDGQNGAPGATGARGPAGPAGADGVADRFGTNRTVSVNAGETVSTNIDCTKSGSHPDGRVAIAGGFDFNEARGGDPMLIVVASKPASNVAQWTTTVFNPDTKAHAYLAWATCTN